MKGPAVDRPDSVRALLPDPRKAAAVGAVAISGGIAPIADKTQRAPEIVSGEKPCYAFRVATGAAFPDGTAVTGADVVESWKAGWLDPDGSDRRLLGVADIREEEDRAIVCTKRPTPDWEARLSDPDLHPRRLDVESGRREGPGSFSLLPDGSTLERNPGAKRRAGLVERVELVEERESDAALLFSLGEIDLAVLHGAAAGSLLADPAAKARGSRLERWDRTYALWLDPRARWVNDPAFRRWLSETIDRQAAVDFLFDGRGEPAYGLLSPGASESPQRIPTRRPFAESSRPRLTLAVDADDPHAAELGARLEAVLENAGVEVTLALRSRGEHRDTAGDHPATLLVHAPVLDDPVLGLQETLWPLAEQARDGLMRLERGSRVEAAAGRAEAARSAEGLLLRDARLVPLVRLHAWWFVHDDLRGIEIDGLGLPRFERARWRR